MELIKTETPATVSYIAVAKDDLVATEGIEININGADFEAEVPEGKLWEVAVTLRIKEFDA